MADCNRKHKSGGVAVRLHSHREPSLVSLGETCAFSVHMVYGLETSSDLMWGRLPSCRVIATRLLPGSDFASGYSPATAIVDGAGDAIRNAISP